MVVCLYRQCSYRQVCVKFKEVSRTSQDYPTVFKDLRFMKNPDLHIKNSIFEMLDYITKDIKFRK